ncbi:MAG: hypothetical protein JJE03_07490 [Peptostreptococcaceae bacterium]|nr:hypothetical protein [Peptostreptococcaceae bacterium]
MKQGVVMKVYDSHAVVLAENEYVKIKLKTGLQQGQEIFFAADDIYYGAVQRRDNLMKIRRFAAVAAVFVLLVTGGFFFAQEDYATLVMVDINPSVQLELDEDEIVTGYEALNDDAKTLGLEVVIGMKVDEAVEYIISEADAHDFIDLEDLDDDYVLIATVSDDGDVEECLREAALENEVLGKVNIAIAKATRDELEEALGAKVPLGLIVSGKFAEFEEDMSVQEFFDNEELRAEFEQAGFVIKEDFGHKVDRVNAHLQQQEMNQEQKGELIADFNQVKEQFAEAKQLCEQTKERYQEALKSGDEEAIQETKKAMEEAELNKDKLEADSVDVDKIKNGIRQNLQNKLEKNELDEIMDQVQSNIRERNKVQNKVNKTDSEEVNLLEDNGVKPDNQNSSDTEETQNQNQVQNQVNSEKNGSGA